MLGNGPSLADADNQILESYPTFGTNGIFLKHIPDYYVTISKEFYKNHIYAIRELVRGVKFIGDNLHELHTGRTDEHILTCNWPIHGYISYRKQSLYNLPVPMRFSTRPDRVVFLGGSVIFICLQLAYWLGYTRIILLGVDHKFGFPRSEAVYGGRRIEVKKKDEIHFDPNYNPSGHSTQCDMLATERSFELALKAFQKDGREIFNATQESGLNIIPKAKLEQIL